VTDHFFVLPENRNLPSGGNRYNHFLIRALIRLGVAVESGGLSQALQRMKGNTRMSVWVDSLYLSRLQVVLESAASKQPIYLIVHHLPSFEPDLDREEIAMEIAREKESFSGVAGFLVTSTYVKQRLEARGLKGKKFIIVPPALCLKPSQRPVEPKRFTGLMVSNLIARKGILEFLESLERVTKPKDEFVVNIAGRHDIEPCYADACFQSAADSSSLKKHIRFLGAVTMKGLEKLYSSSSVFISASKMETFGMAIQEALAFGLPVFAYDGGYAKAHIVERINGYLCSTFLELAEKCVEFIRDPEKLKSLRENSEKPSMDYGYTWDDAAAAFIRQISYAQA